MCGIEIDPLTYQVRVDRYVSMHDAGKILNPMIADGQMRGAFAQGIAAALYEEFVTNEEGAFLTGTFADYLVPTVSEIPPVEMLHHRIAVAVHAARRQGPGRRQLHERAGLHRQRHRRRARRQGRAAAGDAAAHPRADGAGRRRAMKPRPFDYVRPDTVDEAVALLAEHGDEARILAGGQSLMAMMNLRLADPAMLIDIARIAELDAHPRSRRQDRGRRGGDAEQAAGVAGPARQSCRCWPPPCPSSAISRPATRARSAARSRMPIRARKSRCRWRRSKARWCCARKRGERVLKAKDFQLDMLTTAREPDELIVAVRFPVHGRTRRRVPRGGAAARRFRHRRGRGRRSRTKAASGSASAAWRQRRWCGASRRTASRTRSTSSRASSKATRTCTPRRELRRDILRNLAPARHRGGAAMRRVNKDQQGPHQPDAQRPQDVGRGRAAHAAAAISCAIRSARPAPMSAASTASAAAARCRSTARRCARA